MPQTIFAKNERPSSRETVPAASGEGHNLGSNDPDRAVRKTQDSICRDHPMGCYVHTWEDCEGAD